MVMLKIERVDDHRIGEQLSISNPKEKNKSTVQTVLHHKGIASLKYGEDICTVKMLFLRFIIVKKYVRDNENSSNASNKLN